MKLNKLVFLFLMLFCSHLGAQDSLTKTKKDKVTFSEKDIRVDSDSIELKTFSKNFKQKYTNVAFVYEVKTPEKNTWDRFKEWLANIFKNLFSFSNNKTSMNFVEILLKILAIAVVIFVIYLITKSILNKEGSWIFGKNSDKKIINYNEIEKNIHSVDFEKLIQSTLKSGENRLTIRYYYLWLLKKMTAKQIIVWDIEKTNTDYLYEIQNESQKTEFAYLSYLYNYIWYGEVELDEATFEKAKIAFQKSIKSLGNG